MRKFLGHILTVFISLLVMEIVLQVASFWVPFVAMVTQAHDRLPLQHISDERLGIKGNPEYLDHDARGFRNIETLERAEIVALGDSHTYGTSVRVFEAWPNLLAAGQGKSVYNMGLGGYGPIHAAENLDLALSLKPELVIFALYFGNDFYDNYMFAARNDELQKYLPPDLVTAVRAAEREGSIEEEVGFLFTQTINQNAGAGGEGGQAVTDRAADWLSENIRLVGLVSTAIILVSVIQTENALLAPDLESAQQTLTDQQKQYVSVFEGESWKTILTSRYRLRVMDDTDARITAGIEIAKQTIVELHERTVAGGARFLVIFVPTKEYVFRPRVADATAHVGLAALGQTEERLHREIQEALTARDVPVIDLAPALRRAAEQPYFENGDGHPNPLGHEIIARELQAYLAKSGG